MIDFALNVVTNPVFWTAIGSGLAINWIRAS
jgi:hypothetical protein